MTLSEYDASAYSKLPLWSRRPKHKCMYSKHVPLHSSRRPKPSACTPNMSPFTTQEDQSTAHVLHRYPHQTKAQSMYCSYILFNIQENKKAHSILNYSTDIPIQHSRRPKNRGCIPEMSLSPLKKTKAQSMYSTYIPIHRSRRPKHRACTPQMFLSADDKTTKFHGCRRQDKRRRVASRHSADNQTLWLQTRAGENDYVHHQNCTELTVQMRRQEPTPWHFFSSSQPTKETSKINTTANTGPYF